MDRRDLLVFCVDCAIAVNAMVINSDSGAECSLSPSPCYGVLDITEQGCAGPGARLRSALRDTLALQSRHGDWVCLAGFFAKNLLIFAFVESGSGTGYPAQAVPVGLGTVPEMAGKKSLTTGRHASRPRIDAGRGA
jgi:hypothetical protein